MGSSRVQKKPVLWQLNKEEDTKAKARLIKLHNKSSKQNSSTSTKERISTCTLTL